MFSKVVGKILECLFYLIVISVMMLPIMTFLGFLFYPVYCLVHINAALFYLICIVFFIDVICLLCIFVLHKYNQIQSLLLLRTIIYFFSPALLLFFIGEGIYCYLIGLVNYWWNIIIWIVLVIITITLLFQQSIYIYSGKNYLLYLRPFSFDESENIIKPLFENKDVLKIGNPSKLSSGVIGEELFLPMRSWKRNVRYYLSRSSLVFLVLGDTDGSMWEAFENTDYIDKTIFYLRDMDTAKKIILKCKKKYPKSVVFECIEKIIKKDINDCCFYIKENQCIYGGYKLVQEIILCQNMLKLSNQFSSFEVKSEYPLIKETPKSYYIYDILRIISYYIKNAISLVTLVAGIIVYYGGKYLAYIFAPIIILTLLLYWLILLFPSLISNEYIQWFLFLFM